MPTDEERMEFFKENQEVDNAICGANARRLANKKPRMTQEEVDAGIDEMMLLKAQGKSIATYDYNESSWKAKEVKEEKTAGSVSAPIVAKGEKFSFDVIKCANGFLMNMTQDNASKTFIFKTQIELGDIFNQVLFVGDNNEFKLRVQTNSSEAGELSSGPCKENDPKPRKIGKAEIKLLDGAKESNDHG